MSLETTLLLAQQPKVRNKRGVIAIMAEILIEAGVVSTKTQIMCKCNLNHKKIEPYIQILLEKKFLREESSKDNVKKFLTTKKGKRFVNTYQELQI
jgi:predicted transcriptional regulator